MRAGVLKADKLIFAGIDDAVQTYYAAIIQTQPLGLYALAGYSYRTISASKTSMQLEIG